jgi:hypothetical protein
VLDSERERLGDVGGVHVVHQFGAKAGDGDLVASREGIPNTRIEVAQWTDRHPPGTADVTGLQDGGDQPARLRLGGQKCGDGGSP